MTRDEARAVMKTIGLLWPKWNINEEQTALWLEELEKLHNPDYAIAGVKRYCATERQYKSPDLSKIRNHYFKVYEKESNGQEASGGTPGYTGYFIFGTDIPDMNPWYIPVVLMKAGPEHPQYRELIEQERKMYEDTYGGEWKVMDLTQYEEQDARTHMTTKIQEYAK